MARPGQRGWLLGLWQCREGPAGCALLGGGLRSTSLRPLPDSDRERTAYGAKGLRVTAIDNGYRHVRIIDLTYSGDSVTIIAFGMEHHEGCDH